MSLTELLPYLSLQSIVSLLMVLGVGLVAALALLGLRFARRGAARFWLAPSFVTLAWLPLVAGAGLAALGVVQVAQAVGFVGTGSTVALQAGLMEAELPLLLGFLGTAGVAGFGLALLAVGRRRAGRFAQPRARQRRRACRRRRLVRDLPRPGTGLLRRRALAGREPVQRDGLRPSARMERGRRLSPGPRCRLHAGAASASRLGARPRARPVARDAGRARRMRPGDGGGEDRLAAAHPANRRLGCRDRAGRIAGAPPGEPGPVEGDLASAPPSPAPARVASKPIPPTTRPGAVATPVPPLRVGGPIREPKKLKNVPPAYPPAALQVRLQGTVILECLIGVEGRVDRVKVLRGVPLLDEAATEAVRQWEYEPTLLNGVPVPVIMTVTVNFKLS